MEHTFRVNFFGYFYLAKAAVPRMKRGSCIINTGSITGLVGEKTLLDYSATKGAIHAFTKALAAGWSRRGSAERGGPRSGVDAAEPPVGEEG